MNTIQAFSTAEKAFCTDFPEFGSAAGTRRPIASFPGLVGPGHQRRRPGDRHSAGPANMVEPAGYRP